MNINYDALARRAGQAIFLCETDDQIERSENCDNLVMDKEARSCSHPIFYPPEAGLPIGGRTGKKYLKVEIHYNNPTLQSGIIDDSGFVIYATSKLSTLALSDRGHIWPLRYQQRSSASNHRNAR
ncbi:hypothetical protein COOONC_27682 [Cooperia oncophora]